MSNSISTSNVSILKNLGLVKGTASPRRRLGTSDSFASSLKVESIEAAAPGERLTKAAKSKRLEALQNVKLMPEFTGRPEWVPDGGVVTARVEYVEVTNPSGEVRRKVQATLPRLELTEEDHDVLMNL